MSDLQFRPRFRIETSLSCDEVIQAVRTKLREENPEGFRNTFRNDHFVLSIRESERHFWSPQMDISIAPDEDRENVTVVRCLLAPAPVVWTLFMFLYALAGFGTLVGAMIAISQYSLDKEPWGMWIVGISLIIGLGLFFVAQLGKGLSREEMIKLKSFIQEIHLPENTAERRPA